MLASPLEKLINHLPLPKSECAEIFAKMLSGELNEAQIAAYLIAWRMQGETGALLSAGAAFLRAHAAAPAMPKSLRPLGDNCGTGGSGLAKFNISTTAAIIAAACGARIAKHGNRGISSKCGSADLLFAAGFPEKLAREKAVALLEETGLTFFFAPNFHPVMKHVMPVRKALGVRTVFNLIGPLANPLAPDYQLLGVGEKKYLRPVAEAVLDLGIKRGLVVHGRDGLDEISPAVATDGLLVDKGVITAMTIEPKDFGVGASLGDIGGGDAATNLMILDDLLDGKLPRTAQAACLNAGVLLWLGGVSASIEAGVRSSLDCVQSGTARVFFNRWLEAAGR